MNKEQFLKNVSEKTGKTLKDTSITFDAIVEVVEEALAKGEDVSIMKVGKLYSSLVKGRTGVNPLDAKKKITIPDSYRVYFKAGSALKEAAQKQGKKTSKKKK